MIMKWPDRFIASCSSWDDFWEQTKRLPNDGKKGAAFERLIQLYLQTTPEYRTELQHVWLLREVTPDICRRINLPSRDEGIDLIAACFRRRMVPPEGRVVALVGKHGAMKPVGRVRGLAGIMRG
jgi:hypothetical protein